MKDHSYYDPFDGELYIYRGGKLITQNKYAPLGKEEIPQSTECPDCPKEHQLYTEDKPQFTHCYECLSHHQSEFQPARTVHLRSMDNFKFKYGNEMEL